MTEVIHESEKTFRNQTMAVLAPINHSETIPELQYFCAKSKSCPNLPNAPAANHYTDTLPEPP